LHVTVEARHPIHRLLMAIITGLAGVLGRFAGRLLNSTLGWATILLFGKVPQSRQTLLLLIVLGSLAWVAALVGVLVPDVGALLIAAIPLPDFVDEAWVRLAMLIAALLLPLVIGAVALFITAKDVRPSGAGMIVPILRGYPFTLVLTVTIAILAGVALTRKVRSLARRWQDVHVAMIVKPGAYEQLLGQLHGVLGEAGLELGVRKAPALLSLPPRLLDRVAGRALGALVPDNLMLLASPELEILVYPSDLAISGAKESVARAQAAVVSTLTHAPVYMTTSAEAQAVEDELTDISADGAASARLARVRALDERLARLVVPFEEWEILYRQRLQLERDALLVLGDEAHHPPATGARSGTPKRDVVIAAAGLGLIAVDVVLALAERGSRNRR
jgi:hypothetical protein